eukprot:TRINITY_DN249_c0_g1_i1.p1 TRINITY_DN249_c0_g1~~TRINITY_DN249_c0_g1_i1.p1  ORF type:complete len:223 (+),score=37.94 TRINITY_DN249_c0_g1_i1:82-750(+)
MNNKELPAKKQLELLKKEKEVLQQMLSIKVIKTSDACKELVAYIKNTPEALDKSGNPFCEKPSCFAEGTMVTLPSGSFRPIENLKQNDEVLTFNFELNKSEKGQIIHKPESFTGKLIEIMFDDGSSISSTPNHPYYVEGKGWCSFDPMDTIRNYGLPVDRLMVGDQCIGVMKEDSDEKKVKRVVNLKQIEREDSVKVMTLMVEPNNNFFANSVLVHNKCTII